MIGRIDDYLADRGELALVAPDIAVDRTLQLEGEPIVRVHRLGPAHTRGDVVVELPDARILAIGDLVEDGLRSAGVAEDRVTLERFVNEGVTLPSPAEAGTAQLADGPAEVTIILKGTRHTMTHIAGDTILDAGRRAALDPPFSCQLGNCATCMALVHEGSVTMRANNALTPEELAEGWVLTCQGLPDGDVVVEYEDL